MSKNLPFGSIFHEKMSISKFNDGQWSEFALQSSKELNMHPAMHVLHYGSTCFEGLKAFRQENGDVVIFRLESHIKRLQKSAEILNLPIPPADLIRNMIIELVKSAREIIPEAPGSLYLRPTLIGADENIGKAGSASDSAIFFVLASPVGDYFAQGAAMKLLVDRKNARCATHMGRVKNGGNYASALAWQVKAKKEYGANQVLFCPNDDVQETGASNFFLIKDETLITKALDDSFLHGITRDSLLKIAADLNLKTEERQITVAELKEAVKNGAEALLSGTAAVITPVTHMIIDGETIELAPANHSLALRKAITDIQYGLAADKYSWLVKL